MPPRVSWRDCRRDPSSVPSSRADRASRSAPGCRPRRTQSARGRVQPRPRGPRHPRALHAGPAPLTHTRIGPVARSCDEPAHAPDPTATPSARTGARPAGSSGRHRHNAIRRVRRVVGCRRLRPRAPFPTRGRLAAHRRLGSTRHRSDRRSRCLGRDGAVTRRPIRSAERRDPGTQPFSGCSLGFCSPDVSIMPHRSRTASPWRPERLAIC